MCEPELTAWIEKNAKSEEADARPSWGVLTSSESESDT